MNSADHADYRLALARSFLWQAAKSLEAQIWPSCVASCQLAVENSAKCVAALFGPVPHTHKPQTELLNILENRAELPQQVREAVEHIARACLQLGSREHVLSSYGDEEAGLTPPEIFHEEDACNALRVAQGALEATEIVAAAMRPELSDDA